VVSLERQAGLSRNLRRKKKWGRGKMEGWGPKEKSGNKDGRRSAQDKCRIYGEGQEEPRSWKGRSVRTARGRFL